MKLLGSLHGTGKLLTNGSELGSVRYELDVYRDRARKFANGRIEGGYETLVAASSTGIATLQLQNDERLEVIVSDLTAGPSAEITVNGEVPGF